MHNRSAPPPPPPGYGSVLYLDMSATYISLLCLDMDVLVYEYTQMPSFRFVIYIDKIALFAVPLTVLHCTVLTVLSTIVHVHMGMNLYYTRI